MAMLASSYAGYGATASYGGLAGIGAYGASPQLVPQAQARLREFPLAGSPKLSGREGWGIADAAVSSSSVKPLDRGRIKRVQEAPSLLQPSQPALPRQAYVQEQVAAPPNYVAAGSPPWLGAHVAPHHYQHRGSQQSHSSHQRNGSHHQNGSHHHSSDKHHGGFFGHMFDLFGNNHHSSQHHSNSHHHHSSHHHSIDHHHASQEHHHRHHRSIDHHHASQEHHHHRNLHSLPEPPGDPDNPISPYPMVPQELLIPPELLPQHEGSHHHHRHQSQHHHGQHHRDHGSQYHHGHHHRDHGHQHHHHHHHHHHAHNPHHPSNFGYHHHRAEIGLPDFPVGWVEDKHHNHLMTYEKMMYLQEEYRRERLREEGALDGNDLGMTPALPNLPMPDIEAFDMARISGHYRGQQPLEEQVPDAHSAAGEAYRASITGELRRGGPQALAGPIANVVERCKEHAARAQAESTNLVAQLGPNDPRTTLAQRELMQAEAALQGAIAVQSAVQLAPTQQAMSAMHSTVEALRLDADQSEKRFTKAISEFGEQDQRTHHMQVTHVKAAAMLEGAEMAVSQVGREDHLKSELPEAVATRAAAAADAYRAEADEAHAEAQRFIQEYGAKDPRAQRTQQLAEQADNKFRAADAQAAAAQRALTAGSLQAPETMGANPGVGATGDLAGLTAAKKKEKKPKKKKGIC